MKNGHDRRRGFLDHPLFSIPRALLASLAALGLVFYLLRIFRSYRQAQGSGLPSPLFAYAGMAAMLQLLGVLITQRVYTYYLSPLLPLFAILSAWLFVKGPCRHFGTAARLRGEKKPVGRHLLGAGITLLLLAVGLIGGEKLESRMGYYQAGLRHAASLTPGRTAGHCPISSTGWSKRWSTFPSGASAMCTAPSRVISGMRWLPRTRRPCWPALMKKSEIPGERFSATPPPYLTFALESGAAQSHWSRPIPTPRFSNRGIIPMSDMLKRLEEEPPVFLILAGRRGIAGHPQFRDYVKQHYRQSGQVSLQKGKRLQLWERR